MFCLSPPRVKGRRESGENGCKWIFAKGTAQKNPAVPVRCVPVILSSLYMVWRRDSPLDTRCEANVWRRSGADLWITSKNVPYVEQGVAFSERKLNQVRAVDGAADAQKIIAHWTQWKRHSGTRMTGSRGGCRDLLVDCRIP